MPYYKFTIEIKQGPILQFIRNLDILGIDLVWRKYEKLSRDHYKRKMESFKVVKLSKLDPEVKAWITAQGKPDSKLIEDLMNDFGTFSPTANRKKKPGTEGPTLEKRKN